MTSVLGGAAVSEFKGDFRGQVLLPDDSEYDAARVVWNGLVDRRPALVVRPTTATDVATALRFAREQELLLAVRSGGHSVSGLSTCDDGIIVDMSRMRGAKVDVDRRLARVNGGALLAELDREAQVAGLVCPVGVVGHTGVAGLTLGGGMGRIQLKYGLTIDNLAAVELVTADGQLVRASEDENADLFWGLRGAGANFGIATAFEFRLHELGTMVTHGTVVHPIGRAAELMDLFRSFAAHAPDEAMATVGFGWGGQDGPPEIAGRPYVQMTVLNCGPLEEGERVVGPVRAFGRPVLDTFSAKRYLDVQTQTDEAMAWGSRFYMKSAFLPTLPEEIADLCVEAINQGVGDSSISIWSWGRAIAEVPNSATAFTGRDAKFWFAAEAMWQDPAEDHTMMSWGRETLAAVQPFTSTGHYVNDLADRGDDVVRAAYGAEKFDQLVGLKQQWDPDNVFRLNQNIKP